MFFLIRVFIICFVLFFAGQPAGAGEGTDRAQLYADFAARKYVLGPGDIINIKVLGVEELSKTGLKIQPDGSINLSGTGSVQAAGMTFDELGMALEEKCAIYVKNPRVVISLEKSRPFVVQVTGAVSAPGSYEISTDAEKEIPTLSRVLAEAGGISHDADIEHIIIKNRFNGTNYEIDMLELLENGCMEKEICLMAGDCVHVPQLEAGIAGNIEKQGRFSTASFADKTVPVRVIGYVNSPGLIVLDTGVSPTLNTAISVAGGYFGKDPTPPKKVFVCRSTGKGKLVTTEVNPMEDDMTLLPNDVVYVPEKPRHFMGKALDIIMKISRPAGNVASSYNHWSLMLDPERFND